MRIEVGFAENERTFEAPLEENNLSLDAEMGQIQIVNIGKQGATFTPSVSADGVISWRNDGDLPNPRPVNIKGKDGKDGTDGKDGIDGKDGKDGLNGVDGKDGVDGVSATHLWNGTTLTITSASGTSSANLKGEKGDKGDKGDRGAQGIQGVQGERGFTGATGATGAKGDKGERGDNGTDGVSPTVSVQSITNGHRVTVTDRNGTKTFDVTNGAQGKDGASGKDGITPVKGKDYFTDSDKAEMVAAVISALPVYNGEVVIV